MASNYSDVGQNLGQFSARVGFDCSTRWRVGRMPSFDRQVSEVRQLLTGCTWGQCWLHVGTSAHVCAHRLLSLC
jgi:hypothetical protein